MGKPIVTAFGKVRVEAEFVGAVEGPLQISFAEWLDEGVGHAVDRGGVAWRDAFQDAEPRAFLFRAPAKVAAKSVLLGVLAPSEDRFGRPFPFAVVTELLESSYAAIAASLPVAAERFVAEAADVCRAARSAKRASDAIHRAEALRAPSPEECARAAQDFRDWQSIDGALAAAFGRLFPAGPAAVEACFRALVDAVVPMRTRAGVGTSRALRLPLGGGGAVAASFWAEVVRALAHWNRRIPALVWPSDRAAGSLLVPLGEMAPEWFMHVWGDGAPDPRIIDLSAPAPASVADAPPVPSPVARLLGEPRVEVRALLDAFGRIA
jgi:type VI secretion system ImpM family protein